MISSSSLIVHSVVFVGVKLTGEFTSLEEPTDESVIAADTVFSADGPDFVGSERRIAPREPMQSLGFRTSGPSPDPSLQRPELGLVDAVENLRFQRISGFR
jgi:hypothetical protein